MNPVSNSVSTATATAAGTTSAQLWETGERALPKDVRDYVLGGAGREQAIARNRAMLDSIAFLPRTLAGVVRPSAATQVFGKPVTAPVCIAPIGSLDLVQPGSARAVIDAAGAVGMAAIVSILAVGELSALPHLGNTVVALQLYLRGDDDWLRHVVGDAEDRGFSALCVTVDSPVPAYRPRDRRNRFAHRTVLGAPKNVPSHVEGRERQGRTTWERMSLVREMTELPLVVKGILRPDDAARAVDIGFDGVYVSNHGGRNLGATPAPIERVPAIVEAVAGRAPLLVDGGVRDGEDVARALAMGADVVGVGRAHCLALAAAGTSGVQALLSDIREQLETTMALLGAHSVADLDSDLLLVEPGFGALRSPAAGRT